MFVAHFAIFYFVIASVRGNGEVDRDEGGQDTSFGNPGGDDDYAEQYLQKCRNEENDIKMMDDIAVQSGEAVGKNVAGNSERAEAARKRTSMIHSVQ